MIDSKQTTETRIRIMIEELERMLDDQTNR